MPALLESPLGRSSRSVPDTLGTPIAHHTNRTLSPPPTPPVLLRSLPITLSPSALSILELALRDHGVCSPDGFLPTPALLPSNASLFDLNSCSSNRFMVHILSYFTHSPTKLEHTPGDYRLRGNFPFALSAHRTNRTPKTRQGKEGLYHLVYKPSPTLLSTDNGWDKFRSFPCTLFSPLRSLPSGSSDSAHGYLAIDIPQKSDRHRIEVANPNRCVLPNHPPRPARNPRSLDGAGSAHR